MVDGTPLNGYVSRPAGVGPVPAVIMLHELWGLNDQIKAGADILAQEGYVVLAPDLFHDTLPRDLESALRHAQGLDPTEALATVKAAYRWVKNQPDVTGCKVGTLGWCFGGVWALNLGLAEPVDAVAIYYARVEEAPAALGRLNGPVLGVFANRDEWATRDIAEGFEASLRAAGVPHEIHRYDTGHAFANPMSPHYHPDLARDAWSKTLAFLRRHLLPSE